MLKQTTFPEIFEKNMRIKESIEILEKKTDALVAAMTAEEKFTLLGGAANPEGRLLANGGYMKGIPRLGIPEVRMYDGPAGVTSIRQTTGLPTPIVLSATWNEKLAYRFGKAAGSENAAISGNCQLGTQVDIIRTSHFSRNKDMKGEDYVLAAKMGVQETKGVQDQNVIACLKHFAAGNVTAFGEKVNVVIDEQTLHQMYLRPFEEAVERADAGAVMCTYGAINGPYATDNSYLNKTVLRDMWNFKGAAMSDWGANHNMTLGKGMDIEMPRPSFNNAMRILRGIQDQSLSWDDVNQGAKHVLMMMGEAGLLSLVTLDEEGRPFEEYGRKEPIAMAWTYDEDVKNGLLEDNAQIALEIAEKGIVLAKNENKVLPLKKEENIALIGMGALRAMCGTGQERSYGRLNRMISPAKHMEEIFGREIPAEKAIDIIGETIPAEYVFVDDQCSRNGWVRTYGATDEVTRIAPPMILPGGGGLEFNGVSGELDEYGELVENELAKLHAQNHLIGDCLDHKAGEFCSEDSVIDFSCRSENYHNAESGNAFGFKERYTWKGFLKVPESGIYKMKLECIGGESSFHIQVDGNWQEIGHAVMREGAHWPWNCVISTEEGMGIITKTMKLEAGKVYPVCIFAAAVDPNKDLQVRAAWITPSKQKENYEKALAAAEKAGKIVLFLNENEDDCGFFIGDRNNLQLPAEQQQLFDDVSRIAKANKTPLITILQGPGGLATANWDSDSDAVVLAYLAGQESGRALAEILTGEVNPSGKLTQTWPKTDQDTPISDTENHISYRRDGIPAEGQRDVWFSEGIMTGYRWNDAMEVEPGFAFGHGLSYTEFAYSNLQVEQVNGGLEVRCQVKNTGDTEGDEIVQCYIGAAEVPAGVQMAKKQLAAFARVEGLKPQETREVLMTVDPRELCVWNPTLPLSTRENGTKDKYMKLVGSREILVGASSRDIRLKSMVVIEK